MQGGLPVLGQRTTVRWLGSTAVEMVIRDGKAPFASATLVIFLEPRDVPWMWALSRGRGRRDTLIIRGVLRRAPNVEFEALDPRSWSGREALPRVPAEWSVRQAAATGDVVVHYGKRCGARLRRCAAAQRPGAPDWTSSGLSVRRTEPHFQIHVPLPDQRQPARDFFEAVHAIAERALD